MSFRVDDERRMDMAARGFVVRQIVVDRFTHAVTAVWYAYDPEEGRETLERLVEEEGRKHSRHQANAVAGTCSQNPTSNLRPQRTSVHHGRALNER